jgi:hypothetical protein
LLLIFKFAKTKEQLAPMFIQSSIISPECPVLAVAPSVSLTVDDLRRNLLWLTQFEDATIAAERNIPHDIYTPEISYIDPLSMRATAVYARFLYLTRKHPTVRLVPTMMIDLAWHAHQLNPVRYKNDTELIVGRHVMHEPNQASSKSSSQDDGDLKRTAELWQNEYKYDYTKSEYYNYRDKGLRGSIYVIDDD